MGVLVIFIDVFFVFWRFEFLCIRLFLVVYVLLNSGVIVVVGVGIGIDDGFCVNIREFCCYW